MRNHNCGLDVTSWPIKIMSLLVLHIIYFSLSSFFNQCRPLLTWNSNILPLLVWGTTKCTLPPQWKPFQIFNDVNKSHTYSLHLYHQYLQNVLPDLHLAKKTFETRDLAHGSNNHHSSNTWSSWSKPSALIPLVGGNGGCWIYVWDPLCQKSSW